MLRSLSLWLTDTRRQAIQAAFASLLTLVVALNFATADQSALVLVLAAGVLQLAQGVIGLAFLSASDRYEWFNTAGRAAIYAVAAALGPVGVAFQLWHTDASAQIVSIVGVLVTIVSAFVQVVNVQTVPAPALLASEAATAKRFGIFEEAEWGLPFSGLVVGVYAPLRNEPSAELVREILAPARVMTIDSFVDLDAAHGYGFDVVLSTVPITDEIAAAFIPATVTSDYDQAGIRYIGDRL